MPRQKSTLPKLTIYDIKRLTADTEPYFFSRDSMRFFKQTMDDFKVIRIDSIGKYYISAPSWPGKVTERYYNPQTHELEYMLTD